MRIEFMYSRATGIGEEADEAMKQAIEATGVDAEVVYSEINDNEEAKERRFLGSPSIRVDGLDVEYGEREPQEYTSGARFYNTLEGWKPFPHAKMIANMIIEQGEKKPDGS
ncbi:MAG: hypothetical protein ACE5EF_05395 [Dehalococcoidia bacterium]